MKSHDVFPVILAGGSGTRLWPLSRSLYPKQFLKLNSDKSLLQNTIDRAVSACGGQLMIVCNEDHRFLTAEQMREIGHEGTIILEPVARNTAPAIALAALHARCLLYTSPSPRDATLSRMPSSA